MTPQPGVRSVIVVKLFAAAREAAGDADAVEVDLPEGGGAAKDVLEALERRGDALAAVARRSRLAVNQAFARPETPVRAGDEVALIPPVGGG